MDLVRIKISSEAGLVSVSGEFSRYIPYCSRRYYSLFITDKDVCVMAFLGPLHLSRGVFQATAISLGEFAMSIFVM